MAPLSRESTGIYMQTADQLTTDENANDEVLDNGTGTEPAALTGDAANDDQPNGTDTAAEGSTNEGDQDEGAFEIQFGDEAPPASDEQLNGAPTWVRDLRKQNAELQRQVRKFEAQQGAAATQQPEVPTLGQKPTLEQFDYDEAKFDEALGQWYSDKAKVDAVQNEQRAAAQAREQAAVERLNGYRREATELRVKDYQDVENDVVAALTVEQQGIVLAGADRPAAFVYALGRYPNKLKELASIKDPVRFAFAAAKLEKELKVTPRQSTKAAPEGRVTSAAGTPAVGGGEKKLEQLRAEAEKTGDYSKVNSYKRQLKQAQSRR
ncbi:hypothetical protein PIN31009_05549 [Pandoraea iniqua]|nr:hypothetical protein PIN31009_05549 [Pandoraea iniqua]